VVVSNRTHTSVTLSTQKWYHARQIDGEGLSSTVDPFGICAILFWLLTRIDSRRNNDELPHQQARDKLNSMIKNAIKSISSNVDGKTTRTPIGQYSTAKDYVTNAQESFRT